MAGAPFSADSRSDQYLLPHVGVQQRINDKLVLGGGLEVITGLGSDFRDASPIGPKVELLVFGANFGAGYAITPRLSVGASATLGFGLLELGLISNTGLTTAFGVRGTVGATYAAGPALVSVTYNSPMRFEFDKVTETAPGKFSDFELEQPQEVIIGAATSPKLFRNLLFEVNVIWKNWSDAEAYEDIWDDQLIGALGAQYDLGKVKLRAGYIYSSDFLKPDPGSSIGKLSTLAFQGSTLPVSAPLVQFVQATLTQPYWNQQVSVGAGFPLGKKVSLDANAGYAFDGERGVGGTQLDVNEIQVSAGLTWRF